MGISFVHNTSSDTESNVLWMSTDATTMFSYFERANKSAAWNLRTLKTFEPDLVLTRKGYLQSTGKY